MPVETGLAHFMPIQGIAAVLYCSGGHGAAHEDEVLFKRGTERRRPSQLHCAAHYWPFSTTRA